MIPKIIWQTHRFSKANIPPYIKTPIESWVENNKEFEHFYVDESQKNDFMQSFHIKELRDIYFRKGTNRIHQSDIWRVATVYENGGFYADSDLMCVDKIENNISDKAQLVINISHDMFSSVIRQNGFYSEETLNQVRSLVSRIYRFESGPFLQNQFFGAEKNSKFIETVIESMIKISFDLINLHTNAEIGVMEVGPQAWCSATENFIIKNIITDYQFIHPDDNRFFIDINGSRTWNDGPMDRRRSVSLRNIFSEINEYPSKSISNENNSVGTLKFYINDSHGRSFYRDGIDHRRNGE